MALARRPGPQHRPHDGLRHPRHGRAPRRASRDQNVHPQRFRRSFADSGSLQAGRRKTSCTSLDEDVRHGARVHRGTRHRPRPQCSRPPKPRWPDFTNSRRGELPGVGLVQEKSTPHRGLHRAGARCCRRTPRRTRLATQSDQGPARPGDTGGRSNWEAPNPDFISIDPCVRAGDIRQLAAGREAQRKSNDKSFSLSGWRSRACIFSPRG